MNAREVGNVNAAHRVVNGYRVASVARNDLDLVEPGCVSHALGCRAKTRTRLPAASKAGTNRPPMYPVGPVTKHNCESDMVPP